jgi:hypothetical protein
MNGSSRILELIRLHHPELVAFVYKKVLDKILETKFGIKQRAAYGFNPLVNHHFQTRVFAFPLPGTPCTTVQAKSAM